MKDVAREAGVSVQTVSAVVNDKPGITEGTRNRVLETIKKLGYRPYSVARSLRTRKTRTLSLIISDIANPSFATMASVAEEYTHRHGYSLVLYNTHDDIEREGRYLQTAIDRWIDGILFVAAQDRMDGLHDLQAAGIPTVAIDRIPEGYTGPSVSLNNEKAGRLAVEHLIDLGHTQIAHIAGPMHLSLSRERAEGFRATLREHQLEPVAIVPSKHNWECAAGYVAMQELLALSSPPTAVFTANDRMAIGGMRATIEAGLRVPEDISFVGLDDIEISEFQNPPLSTIDQSFQELAALSVQLLLDLVAGEKPDLTQIVVEPQLIVRQSSVPAQVNVIA
jgi:LacI family transcriptional regulator